MTRRETLVRAGVWPSSKGFVTPIAEMSHGHLINAYLKALADGDSHIVSDALGAEVLRRGLRERCESEVLRRQGRTQCI